MGRVAVPISDYVGDTKGALDNSVRVLQAITDLAADAGWLGTALSTMHLIQGLMQVRGLCSLLLVAWASPCNAGPVLVSCLHVGLSLGMSGCWESRLQRIG